MAIYQQNLSRGIGAYLSLDAKGIVKCAIPEFFDSGNAILPLTLFPGSDVSSVDLKDGSILDYIVVGNNIEFVSAPTADVMVSPKQHIDLIQFLKWPLPVQVYLIDLPKFKTSDLTISSIDFKTDAVGPLAFCSTKTGEYTSSINLASAVPFWVKGTATAAVKTSSLYLTIAGEVTI